MLASTLLLLIGCGGAVGARTGTSASPNSPTPPIAGGQPSTAQLATAPQLLVWNSDLTDASATDLYAYWLDSSGSLQVLPGFPLKLDGTAIADPAARLLFVKHLAMAGSATLDSFLLTSSGPQLTGSLSAQQIAVPPGTLPEPPVPAAVWAPTHELLGFYQADNYNAGSLQRFSYDATGKLASLDQPQTAPSFLYYLKPLPASNMLVAWDGYYGHTCGDLILLSTWTVAADGSLNPLSQTALGDGCSLPPLDYVAVSRSGRWVAAAYEGGQLPTGGTGPAELRMYAVNSDGTLQQVSTAPLPTVDNVISNPVVIDEVHNLIFVLQSGSAGRVSLLLWYSFDPAAGQIAATPSGTLPNPGIGDIRMIGNYLVAAKGQGVIATYSVTTTGLSQVSEQTLPLPGIELVPLD